MKTLLASGRCKVDVSVLPVFRLEGYETLPASLREFLGGLTHSEHVAHVDALIAEDLKASRISPLGLFSASELFEEASSHAQEQPTLETLSQVVSQEVLGAGTYLEYESASALLADLDPVPQNDSDIDEFFLDAFEDLQATFSEAQIDALHRDSMTIALETLHAAPRPSVVTLNVSWADHQLETQAIYEDSASGPTFRATPEFSVALAVLGVSGATAQLSVQSFEDDFNASWAFASGDPTPLI